jgi:aldose 1-epimerase
MQAANPAYTARQSTTASGLAIVRLTDEVHKTEVSILVSIGNNAFDMRVNGKPVFWSPYASIEDQKAKPAMLGNPFLAPWANRLDHEGFYAAGHHYPLNPDLKNYRKDGNGQPIHGMLLYTDRWALVEASATAAEAVCKSRLEFWKYPDLMAQFPFAHSIEMTYRLRGGALEVETTLRNMSVEAMPVAIGFHPYFQITDAPRDEWTVTLPVRERVVLSPKLVPTGEREPSPYSSPFSLKGVQLDDVFTGMSSQEFSVAGRSQKIVVEYGRKYPVAVVYAPPGRGFICFEPMAGVTNAMNLAQAGKNIGELQTIPPGGTWTESYWIRPSGF